MELKLFEFGQDTETLTRRRAIALAAVETMFVPWPKLARDGLVTVVVHTEGNVDFVSLILRSDYEKCLADHGGVPTNPPVPRPLR